MENKKRELKHDHSDDDDLEDETKMEKFYSLLRSFRDARDRRRRELQDLEKQESKKMKFTNNNITNAAEKAKEAEDSFEWQDFTAEIQFRKPPLVFPDPIPCNTVTDPTKGKKKEKQRPDLALDLKLSL